MPETRPPGAFAPQAEPKLPGLAGIWIGAVMTVVGIVLGIVLVAVGAMSVLDGVVDLQRVSISGGGEVTFRNTGTVSVYAERPSSESGSGYTTGGLSFVPPVGIVVTGPDGSSVDVRPRSGNETYHFEGREGVEIARFEVERPGVYEIETVLRGEPSPYRELAVGNAIDTGGLVMFVVGLVGGGLLALVGLIVLIVSIVRRSGARKRSVAAARWPGPPGPFGVAGPLGSVGPVGPVGPGWAPPPVVVPDSRPFAPQQSDSAAPHGWVPPPPPPRSPDQPPSGPIS